MVQKDPPGELNPDFLRQTAIKIEEAPLGDRQSTQDRADNAARMLEAALSVERGDPHFWWHYETSSSRTVIGMFLSQCFVCNRLSVWQNSRLLYPAFSPEAPIPSPDLSTDIKRDYDEAAVVLSQSPRSCCALLRLSIQKLCEQILGRKGDVNEMIGELVSKGLSPIVQQAMDVVRVVGNEAVHPGTLDLRDDVDTAQRLFGLVNIITDMLITQPRHISELYATLPNNKLIGIQSRDAKTRSAQGS